VVQLMQVLSGSSRSTLPVAKLDGPGKPMTMGSFLMMGSLPGGAGGERAGPDAGIVSEVTSSPWRVAPLTLPTSRGTTLGAACLTGALTCGSDTDLLSITA